MADRVALSGSSLLSPQAPARCPCSPTCLCPTHSGCLALICAVLSTSRFLPTSNFHSGVPQGLQFKQAPHQLYPPLSPPDLVLLCISVKVLPSQENPSETWEFSMGPLPAHQPSLGPLTVPCSPLLTRDSSWTAAFLLALVISYFSPRP